MGWDFQCKCRKKSTFQHTPTVSVQINWRQKSVLLGLVACWIQVDHDFCSRSWVFMNMPVCVNEINLSYIILCESVSGCVKQNTNKEWKCSATSENTCARSRYHRELQNSLMVNHHHRRLQTSRQINFRQEYPFSFRLFSWGLFHERFWDKIPYFLFQELLKEKLQTAPAPMTRVQSGSLITLTRAGERPWGKLSGDTTKHTLLDYS